MTTKFRGKWPNYDVISGKHLTRSLSDGRLAISGYRTGGKDSLEKAFSKSFSRISGCYYNIPCSSGSAALSIALQSLGVGQDDEVIVPSCTWIAPVAEVLRVNAKPIVVDVDPITLCIDVDEASRAITSATKAVIAVHLYGNSCDMAKLKHLCTSLGVALLEDCAQAHGGVHDLGNLGSLGDCSIYSFQQSKQITSGEGGAVCTNDHVIAQRVEALKNNGRVRATSGKSNYDVELQDYGGCVGSNAGLTEFQIGMLLDSCEEFESRRAAVRAEMENFADQFCSVARFPASPDMQITDRYCLPVVFPSRARRDAFINASRSVDIGSFFVGTMNEPVNRSAKFEPWQEQRFRFFWDHRERFESAFFVVANNAQETGAFIHHSMFIDKEDIDLVSDCMAASASA